jgi:2-methylisocitrate lyase-like PEP mutase family enzyme
LQKLSQLIRGNDLIVAPVALNPIMARLAEEAGFKAVYMSGGSLGWYKCVTEANITLPEMAQLAVDMHVTRTIALAEAAGFAAIEIEDQLLPRRVEHHVGIEHLVPTEFMVEKVKAAVAARTDPDFVIVARTNARRLSGLDEALRRGEAFKQAGADMIFVFTRTAEEMRILGERLPPPLMMFAPPDGFAEFPLKQRDLAALGFRLAASSGTAFAAMVKAVRQSYECLAQGKIDPFIGKGNVEKEMKAAMATTGLDRLLEIERRTMKE